jgi:hypothetical protein
MKQNERKAVAIGNDSAVIQECSNNEARLVPRLILHSAQYAEEGVMFPAASIMFYGAGVRTLYEFLRDYYSNPSLHDGAASAPSVHGVVQSPNQEA